MKKLLSAILVLSMCLSCIAALASCSKEKEGTQGSQASEHACEIDTVWSYDESNHWHNCTESECGKTYDLEQHDWAKGALDNGDVTYTCTLCGATKTENKAELYKNVCNKITEKVNSLGQGQSVLSVGANFGIGLLSSEGNTYVDAAAMEYIQVKGVMSFVDMLARMIENTSFRITSEPVKFTYSYAPHSEQGTAVLMYEFDEENNKVVMYWDVISVRNSVTTDIFLYMDIDYDFATDTVGDFKLHSLQSIQEQTMVLSYIYEDGALKSLNRTVDFTSVTTEIEGYKAVIDGKKESVIDLEADFTAEYTAMMNAMNSSRQ